MKSSSPRLRTLYALACFACSPLSLFSAPDFYVAANGNDTSGNGSIGAPFATLDRARQEVAKVNSQMGADIHVYVRGGTYYLTTPVVFGASDSGTNGFNVIYQAYGSEIPVFTGGVQITQWTDVGGGLYTTNVGTLRFRQLYVNDRRAIRARTPNVGSFYQLISWNPTSKTITVNASDVSGLDNLGAIEMVVTRSWQQNRLRVSAVSASGSTADLSFETPEGPVAFGVAVATQRANAAYYFENSLSCLDEEDEWYLDPAAGTLYYKPRVAEPIANSRIVIPTIDTLIKLQGDSLSAPVHDIQFVGLTFAHTTWNSPDSNGFVDAQAGFCYLSYPGAAVFNMKSGVYADKADSLRFENNIFSHMGGQALTLFSACHHNTIQGNIVYDISGNGIGVDMAVVKAPSDPRMTSSDNDIVNNYVFDCAADYRGSVGIFGGYVKNTRVEHNEVANLPYTGISVGWGWTLDDNPAFNNSIQYNHIHHVVMSLQDGAGIYTLSKQPGTAISNNYIHDIRRSPWTEAPCVPIGAIYLDNGSSYMTVSNNVILPVERRIHQSGHPTLPATNNTLSGNDGLIADVVDQAGPAAAYLPSPASPALVGYWKMESATGAMVDSSGWGNNGTISGPATTGTGICGNAIWLSGSSKITVPDKPNLRLQRFTICAWIRPDVPLGQMPSFPMVVSKQNHPANMGYHLGTLFPGANEMGVRFLTGTSTAFNQQTDYQENSSSNWIHVAGVYDGNSLRIYRNGVLESELLVAYTAINNDATALTIGNHFQGWMDEVRIYNDALSDSELQTLVDMRMDPSIVARWPMDEGHPTFLPDLSGKLNFGTIYPSTASWVPGPDGRPLLSFSGGDTNAVTAPDSTSLRVQNYTISTWILPSKPFNAMASLYPSLVNKQDYPGGAGYYLGSVIQSSNNLGNRFLSGTTGVRQTSYSESSSGSWIHVVGTYDGNALSIYRNGILQSQTATGPLVINHDSVKLLIGRGFEGVMRDVRIYNRALSDTEVELLGP